MLIYWRNRERKGVVPSMNMRSIASICYYANISLALISLASFVSAWLSYNVGGLQFIVMPSIINTLLYAVFVIYWRFWYVFALPAILLNYYSEDPSRKRLIITLASIALILVIQFLYGYKLPD